MYSEHLVEEAVLDNEQLEFDFFENQKEKIMAEKVGENIPNFIDTLRDEIGYDWISYYELDPITGVLEEVELNEMGFNLIDAVKFQNGFGLAGWVAEHQRPILLSSVHKSQRFESNPIKSFMCCPVIQEGATIGVINLGHTKSNTYSNSTLKKLNQILNF